MVLSLAKLTVKGTSSWSTTQKTVSFSPIDLSLFIQEMADLSQ